MSKRSLRLVFSALFILIAIISILPSLAHSESVSATSLLSLVQAIEVGGMPQAIIVDHWDSRNDIVFYDRGTGTVKFLDGDSLTLAPEQLSLSTWNWDSWIAYDHYYHLTYVVCTRLRSGWREGLVHILSGRTLLGTFSINEPYNIGQADPPDDFYDTYGLAFKQPFSEGANPGRLIVDCTRCGAVDVLDFNAAGTEVASRQRYSYRAPVTGTMYTINGNSLALEVRHETDGSGSLDGRDVLYIYDEMDPDLRSSNARYGQIQVVSLGQPPQALNAQRLPDVDLNDTWPFPNGMQGLAMAGPRDILYVASGLQSFSKGYIAEVNTTSNTLKQVIELTYGDQYEVLVDWHDPRRVFVTTFDGFYNDPDQALYLHLVYDGQVRDTLTLLKNFTERDMRRMAYDPFSGRLYLTVGSQILVVQVNDGGETAASASTTISTAGGALALADGSIRANFPAGSVTEDTAITCNTGGYWPTGNLLPVRLFELLAVTGDGHDLVTAFTAPYTLIIEYSDAQASGVSEESLGLYSWDGNAWQLEGTATVDTNNNRVTATLDHMTPFAVLGEALLSQETLTYLPLALKDR